MRQAAGYSEIWRLSRPCSRVKNQGNTTTRPLNWEDEAPAESRFRRVQQGVPRTGRALPGMPLEMEDRDGEDPPRSRRGSLSRSWWRPASTVGRVSVALGALLVLGALTTAGVVLRTYLERDARFRITGTSHIEAVGLSEVTRAELLPVFGEDIGRNIFFVPIGERRKELEAIPWVERATVMRLLPDQLRVEVVERQPVAFTRHGQQIGLVDANGVLLDMSPATMAAHHYSFPVVTGIDPGDPAESRKARMTVYTRLMAELDANNQHNSEQISEIDLTDPEDARVLMPEQGADLVAHFGEDHFLERYQRYKAHIAEWRQQYPKLAAVDLRYEHQVVLEMASGLTAAAPAADADARPGALSYAGPGITQDGASNAALDVPTVLKAASPAKSPAGKAAMKSAPVKAGGKTAVKSAAKNTAKSTNRARTAAAKAQATTHKKTAQARAATAKAATTRAATARTATVRTDTFGTATASESKKKPSPATRPSDSRAMATRALAAEGQ